MNTGAGKSSFLICVSRKYITYIDKNRYNISSMKLSRSVVNRLSELTVQNEKEIRNMIGRLESDIIRK